MLESCQIICEQDIITFGSNPSFPPGRMYRQSMHGRDIAKPKRETGQWKFLWEENVFEESISKGNSDKS